MKKLIIVLAAIVVIRLGSIAFFETQLLEEPIILAQDIDLYNDTLYLSYITNSSQPHEIMDVVINGQHFYPYQETNFNGFISSSNQSSVYVNGRMYSIYYATFPLQSEWNEVDFSTQTTSTIHFKDGIQFEEPLAVSRPWGGQISSILYNSMSSSSSDGTGIHTYTTEQDVVLTNLSFEQLENVTLSINSEQVDLPIQAPIKIPNDSLIKITTKAQLGFYPNDQGEFVLYLNDESNVPIEIPITTYNNNSPTSEWIHQYVKERAKK